MVGIDKSSCIIHNTIVVIKKCKHCHNRFEARVGEVNKGFGLYCSRKCGYEDHRKYTKRKCIVCKKEFYPKNKANKLCSRKCYGISKLSKDARKIDKSGYILVKDPNNFRAYIREHRLVMQQHIGRQLEAWELVHHLNSIKNDNRIENLIIITASEHMRRHKKGVPLSEIHKQNIAKAHMGMKN